MRKRHRAGIESGSGGSCRGNDRLVNRVTIHFNQGEAEGVQPRAIIAKGKEIPGPVILQNGRMRKVGIACGCRTHQGPHPVSRSTGVDAYPLLGIVVSHQGFKKPIKGIEGLGLKKEGNGKLIRRLHGCHGSQIKSTTGRNGVVFIKLIRQSEILTRGRNTTSDVGERRVGIVANQRSIVSRDIFRHR